MKALLRTVYNYTLRGTALGNALRQLYFGRGRYSVAGARHFIHRASYAGRYFWVRLRLVGPWLLHSQEDSNFTYTLTARNKQVLAEMLSVVLGAPAQTLLGYFSELETDTQLAETLKREIHALGPRGGIDPAAKFGRRLGWYAIVRHRKPHVVVETGVDKGLGALVLCSALLRNAAEGRPGRYYGTDIDRGAGVLLCSPYNGTGEVLYGDSIESLTALNETIDFFVCDSDHSATYEAREYVTVENKLAPDALIIADNAHVTDALLQFSRAHGRKFLFFREEPADHWYQGAGIGFSFK